MFPVVDTCSVSLQQLCRLRARCDARCDDLELYKAEPAFSERTLVAVHATKAVAAVWTAFAQCEIVCATTAPCSLQTHTDKHVRID
jgi:hypothetical protein